MREKQIAVRAYTMRPSEKNEQPRPSGKGAETKLKPYGKRVMVLDTETTTDFTQNLLFGQAIIVEGSRQAQIDGILVGKYLFYDEQLPQEDLTTLQQYAEKRRVKFLTRQQFVEQVFLPEVWELGTLCVGFNLPFDLSRIADNCKTHIKGRYKEYFTFELIPGDIYSPQLAIRSLDSKKAFIELTRPAKTIDRMPPFKGNFLDLRTLVFALTNESRSLDSSCELFKVGQGKQKAEKHGQITPEYIDYNRQDVMITWELYKKLRGEYGKHPLPLSPSRAYSPASIGKAYMKEMGIRPLLVKQPGFDPDILGKAMVAYYGGRSECHIRKIMTRVLYADVTSMYPTVFILQGLWNWVIADSLEVIEATEEIRGFVDNITLDKLFNKSTWLSIPGLVQVKPDQDILPVRTNYNGDAYQIGLNHLSSKEPLWYSLADVIVSKLLTGKTPEIIKAYRVKPGKQQDGLKPVKLMGEIEVDPARENFFKTVIEKRATIKKQMKGLSKESNEYRRLYSLQLFLKILANSTSYGIFIELNENELDKETTIDVYGLDDYPVNTDKVEENGYFTNPLTAIMITGASRLILAMIEKNLHDNDLDYVFCDTDSMAIRMENEADKEKALGVINKFANINPYDPATIPGSILKIEDENYALSDWSNQKSKITKEMHPLYCYMVSAKRYVLFNLVDGKPVIRKKSDHGLGHLKNPVKKNFDNETEDDWIDDIWLYILNKELGLSWEKPAWWDYPAMGQHTVSKPHLHKAFRKINLGKTYKEQIKPFSFLSIWYQEPLAGTNVTPISPFVQPQDIEEVADSLVDRKTGNKLDLWSLLHERKTLKTYGDIVEAYTYHPEAKYDTPDGEKCPKNYRGVLARTHIKVTEIKHIGKEANNLEEADIFGVDEDSYLEYINQTWGKVREKAKAIGAEKLAIMLQNNGLSKELLESFLEEENPPKNIIGMIQFAISHDTAGDIFNYNISSLQNVDFKEYRYIPYWNAKTFTIKLLVRDKGTWFFVSGRDYNNLTRNHLIKRMTVKNIMRELTYQNGIAGTRAISYPEFLPVQQYAGIWKIKTDIIRRAIAEGLFAKNEIRETDEGCMISRTGIFRLFKDYQQKQDDVDLDSLTVIVKRGNKIFEFPLQDLECCQYRKRPGNSRKAEVMAKVRGNWYFMPVGENPVIFKKRIMARPREIEMARPFNGYLQSEVILFPDYVSIEEASTKWQIAKDKLLNDIREGRIILKDNKISRLGLGKYLINIKPKQDNTACNF